MNTAQLRLDLGSPEAAQRARAALEPDNDGFAAIQVDGSTLVVEAEAEAVMGLLRTIDDVLQCIRPIADEEPPHSF